LNGGPGKRPEKVKNDKYRTVFNFLKEYFPTPLEFGGEALPKVNCLPVSLLYPHVKLCYVITSSR
jgi:hypothetical protein